MANPLLALFGGGATGTSSGIAILLQAVGAAMRGESANDFMTRLANERPELKKVDLSDLPGSAEKLCQQNGVKPEELAQKIDGIVEPVIRR